MTITEIFLLRSLTCYAVEWCCAGDMECVVQNLWDDLSEQGPNGAYNVAVEHYMSRAGVYLTSKFWLITPQDPEIADRFCKTVRGMEQTR